MLYMEKKNSKCSLSFLIRQIKTRGTIATLVFILGADKHSDRLDRKS